MADRYWVGGTANWDLTAGSKWALTSGGAGGQSVPTVADDVFFDAASGAVTVTVAVSTGASKNLTFTGFTGTIAGSVGLRVDANFLLASSVTWTNTGAVRFGGATSCTLTSAGKTLGGLTINSAAGSGLTVTLQDALTLSGVLDHFNSTFTTNNYAVTASSISSSNSNTRTINLGSSTVTLSGANSIDFTNNSNLTFNAGTSSIVCSGVTGRIFGGTIGLGPGQTFNNISWTNSSLSVVLIEGLNTFNNVTVAGRSAAGLTVVIINTNQTINGTLTLSAGTDATMRTFVYSNTIGTTRTLTCAAVASLTDIDFRDITIAGAAAPVSGTRLGDAKGNSGITFGAGVTKYWNLAAGGNWVATGWATSSGGTPAINNFPLAQDTALFEATGLTSGSTISMPAAFNIGTIDMSARTSNTMTFACSQSPVIYGNWINGTGVTFTGAGTFIFAGRGSQTITTAGRTFTQAFTVDSPSGSITLQDAFITSRSNSQALRLVTGTFDANNYNASFTGASAGFSLDGSSIRTIAIGSGTLTIAGTTSAWQATTSTNLTITGTGTISLTSASTKTFNGGDIQTYPILNQGGTGTLTVTGSNKFTNITNTAIGRVQFTGGTTNEFGAFNLNGVLGNLLPLGSTNTTQATLNAPSWNVGIASTDAGNNTGLSFTGLSPNFLSISYINGVVTAAPASGYGNFFLLF
ncbi:hypothetical protein UFOVP376_54 [uncultured Caudovirales phage]|uniref:Autotransporter-associated beta strand repeat n=1 Tax=uncultured Caudovirales phage TaxID=2100421 RepID=A0A6J7X298_9CAUD|nr:hypothetical protein UFOVP376_54 [uncultured Caudovirales phage]